MFYLKKISLKKVEILLIDVQVNKIFFVSEKNNIFSVNFSCIEILEK